MHLKESERIWNRSVDSFIFHILSISLSYPFRALVNSRFRFDWRGGSFLSMLSKHMIGAVMMAVCMSNSNLVQVDLSGWLNLVQARSFKEGKLKMTFLCTFLSPLKCTTRVNKCNIKSNHVTLPRMAFCISSLGTRRRSEQNSETVLDTCLSRVLPFRPNPRVRSVTATCKFWWG